MATTIWPSPQFPPGMRYYKAFLKAVDGSGRPVAGTWQMELETPLVWAATGDTITNQINKRQLVAGYCEFWVPYSGQPGFTAGLGGAAIVNFGVRFEFEPNRTTMMAAQGDGPGGRYVIVTPAVGATEYAAMSLEARLAAGVSAPTDDGIPVRIANLTNIGAWPHRTVVVNQPPTAGGYTWRQAFPGSYVPTAL